MRRLVAAAAALMLLALPAAAQQPEDQPPVQQPAPSSAPSPPASPASQPGDLIRETLPTDIQTADYYELVAWCRGLGLSDAGSKAELQARLYQHFKVKAPPEPAKPERVIVVQSARTSDYFTIDSVKEDYLVLTGDVSVEFRDEASGVTNRVSAQRLIVNQTRRTLSASGGVTYELIRKTGAPEVFRGESFTFDLKGWGGIIVDGRGQSQREMEQGKPPIDFFYRGKSIVRRENDTVILRDGSVTSSMADDPYWQIAASRIWVLGPGEWAIKDAVLEVGRVPLFYVPFFYRPGDQILFHPSLGYRNREGSFIQTTTYFIGQAEQRPSTLSFLRLTAEDSSYDTEVQGIFLHKVKKGGQPPAGGSAAPGTAPAGGQPGGAAQADDGQAPQQPAQQAPQPAQSQGGGESKDVFKIMADYYSRLGYFGGLVLQLDPVWSLKGGIGFTRNLYETSTGAYSPYPPDSTVSEWNTAQFAGLSLPFRYGFDAGLSLTGTPGSLQAALSLFSDPYFSSDFFNRSERMNWTGLLAGPGATAAEATPGGLDPTERDNLSWTMNGRLSTAPAAPWLSDLDVQQLNLALYWQGRDNTGFAVDDPAKLVDPARRFFVPTRVVAPDLKLHLAGTLLQSGTSAAAGSTAAAPAEENKQEEPRIPQPEEGSETPAPQPELQLPKALPDLPGLDLSNKAPHLALGYTLDPRLFFEGQYNQQSWNTPQSINFEFLYSSLEVSGTQSLTSSAGVWDDRLQAKAGLNVGGVYRTRSNRASELSDSDWDALRLKDYQATTLTIGPSLDLSVLPLGDRRAWSASTITYGIAWDVFHLSYAGMSSAGDPIYRTRTFDFDSSTVDRHELDGRLSYRPGIATQFLDVKADLPPRDGYYRGEADMTLGFSHTNVRGGYKQTATGWVYDPLVTTETLDPFDWLEMQSRVETNVNGQELNNADTALRLVKLPSAAGGWLFEQRVVLMTRDQPLSLSQTTLSALGFSARYLAEQRPPVEWSTVSSSFILTGEPDRLLPAELSLTYQAPQVPLLLWLNRIQLTPIASSSVVFDLYRFTSSRLEITAGVKASIYRFLDLDVSVTSYNDKLYRYIRPWVDQVGGVWVNPVQDLLSSYAFGKPSERRLSNFKLRSISVKATHDLGDWDVTLEYTGSQQLEAKAGGGEEYRWTPVFSIVVEWKPIPEIRREIHQDKDTGLSVKGGTS